MEKLKKIDQNSQNFANLQQTKKKTLKNGYTVYNSRFANNPDDTELVPID